MTRDAGRATQRVKLDAPVTPRRDDYVPQSRAWYNPDLSPQIAGQAMNARLHVSQGGRFGAATRSLGRTASEPTLFSTTQDDIRRAAATIEAEQRAREIQPFALPSPPKTSEIPSDDNPFELEPLTDFGESLMSSDPPNPFSAVPSSYSSSPSHSMFSKRKRRRTDEENDDDPFLVNGGREDLDVAMDEDASFVAPLPRFEAATSRPFRARRPLGKSQSMPEGSLF